MVNRTMARVAKRSVGLRNLLAPAGAPGSRRAPKALPPLSMRALAKRALQVAIFVFVPGGTIVLALLWWFNQGGDA